MKFISFGPSSRRNGTSKYLCSRFWRNGKFGQNEFSLAISVRSKSFHMSPWKMLIRVWDWEWFVAWSAKKSDSLLFQQRVWSEKKSNWYIIFILSSLLSSFANVIWLRRQNWSFELVHLEREKEIQKSTAKKNCFQWGLTDTMTSRKQSTGFSVYSRIIQFDLLIKRRFIYEVASMIARENENKSEWVQKSGKFRDDKWK